MVDWICLCFNMNLKYLCVTVKLIQWPASDSTVHSIQEVLGDGEGLAAGELLGFIYPSQVHHYFSPLHFVFWPMPWTDRLTRTSWRNLGYLSSRKFMLGWWNVQYQTDWRYQIAQLMALFTGDSALVREWYSWELESRTGLSCFHFSCYHVTDTCTFMMFFN